MAKNIIETSTSPVARIGKVIQYRSGFMFQQYNKSMDEGQLHK